MSTELELLSRVEDYLTKLGYQTASFVREGGKLHRFADMIVYDQEVPRVVVEVKSDLRQLAQQKQGALQFHPYVRNTQSIADSLSAPYFLLADGEHFLWFSAGRDGLPKLLTEPIYPTISMDVEATRPSKAAIVRVLQEFAEVFYRFSGPNSLDETIATLYAEILSDRGDCSLKSWLCQSDRVLASIPNIELRTQAITFSDPSVFVRAFGVLERVRLVEAWPLDLLTAIDEVLFQQMQHYSEFRVPRWLNSFALHLMQAKSREVILDLNSYGDLFVPALQTLELPQVQCICRAPSFLVWAKLQAAIMGHQRDEPIIGATPPYDVYDSHRMSHPTFILVVPPFGGRIMDPKTSISFRKKGHFTTEELYLELAYRWVKPGGRIVAVVPEGFLFSGNSQITREFLYDAMALRAIIGLGNISKRFPLRVSVLVFEKCLPHKEDQIFMTRLEASTYKDKFNCREISQVALALDSFIAWSTEKATPILPECWTIDINNLRPANWVVDTYSPDSTLAMTEIAPSFNLFRLAEIAKIYRGSSFKLDEEGDLLVIGPAAIRPMFLDTSEIKHAKQEALESSVHEVRSGDIVVNLISTYRGAAALIQEDLKGAIINRHVAMLRPIASQIQPEYLAIAINSDYIKRQIERDTTGVVIPSVNLKILGEILVPVPDLETQREIVERAGSLRSGWLAAQRASRNAELVYLQYLADLGKA